MRPTILRRLLPDSLHRSLATYAKALSRTKNELEIHEEWGRMTRHNDPIFSLVHERIEPTASYLVGAEVKRSYCFLALYRNGAVVPKHRDRPQCKYTIGLCLSAVRPWPLYLGRTRVDLDAGDAVLYDGTVPHWRRRLTPGNEVDMVLFHFVEKTFESALD